MVITKSSASRMIKFPIGNRAFAAIALFAQRVLSFLARLTELAHQVVKWTEVVLT